MAAAAADYHQSGRDAGGEWRVTLQAGGVAKHERKDSSKASTLAWPFPWASELQGFATTAWKTGAEDPRKVIHGIKMGMALTLCSVFYYVRPLYLFTGENAIWAILTVVLIFEYTVGGCVYKGLNRAMATVVGGAMALGVHWIASKAGKELEPYILSASLSVLAAVATFSRFIPALKARFEYGATIFILTYALVGVSGYRVEAVAPMALQRLMTVSIGAVICLSVCALVCPVWAGQELHSLVARNMDKLAADVEACVDHYFSAAAAAAAGEGSPSQGYMSVLNAKASEDSLATLAWWEPGHGKFGFSHPYGHYQKLGAALRRCAHVVDTLAAASVCAEAPAPARVKKRLDGACATLNRHCATVLRVASASVASMTCSGRLALAVGDMNAAAKELRAELRRLAEALEEDSSSVLSDHKQNAADDQLPSAAATPRAQSLVQALPLFTAASLLLEICARVEGVVGAVNTLATTARFKKSDCTESTPENDLSKPLLLEK
ncbi:hypothetical protein ACP4OV_005535 [Aristida adscensionis]